MLGRFIEPHGAHSDSESDNEATVVESYSKYDREDDCLIKVIAISLHYASVIAYVHTIVMYISNWNSNISTV